MSSPNTPEPTCHKTIYRIDPADRIVYANEHWWAFAQANQAPELVPAAVIGRSLWEFITADSTKKTLAILLDTVRRKQRPVTLPYRCDSPRKLRFMEVDIEPFLDGSVQFTNRTLFTESCDYTPLLERFRHCAAKNLPVCGWCNKVRLPDSTWVDLADAIRLLDLFAVARLPEISHVICEACVTAIKNQIK